MIPSFLAQKPREDTGLMKEAHKVIGGVCFPPLSQFSVYSRESE